MKPRTMLEWALAYASLGWHVFPVYMPIGRDCSCSRSSNCPRKAKHPITKSGHLDATSDPEQIAEWWATHPSASIARRTDDSLVIDVDGEQGRRTLAALEREHGKLPRTVLQATGGGGLQYFYEKSSAGRTTANALGRKIDTRASGGYVILPPSRHASGRQYRWIRSPFAHEIAKVPGWVEGKLKGPRLCVAPGGRASRSSTKGAPHTLTARQRQRLLGYRSDADLEVCLSLLNAGASDAQLTDDLLRTSEKAREKGGRLGAKYIARLVAIARSAHEASAPVYTIRSARPEVLPERFGHAPMLRIHFRLQSDDGEIVHASIVVPSRGYDSEKIRAVWDGCFPGVDPRGITHHNPKRANAAWDAIGFVGRRLRIAIRNREVKWLRAAERDAA